MAKEPFYSDLLRTDPGLIAFHVTGDPELVSDVNDADAMASPACQSARASYRTALIFRILFTSLVYAVALASTAALVIAIIRIVADGVSATSVVSGVAGLLGSGGLVFLVKQMNGAIKVEKAALADVKKYCGVNVANQLSGG